MIERIGNCRIVEEIGSGGMAVIYKAVQESLNRTVAVKALKTSVAQDSQFAIRFEREALSVSSLQHENIIHIYDFHKLGGAYFIVMEYVEGIDLYDLLDKCPMLPPDVAAIIAMQVARGLDYAHYRGIIHRDIKPANIMIGKNGGVKLMDFGIARDQAFGDLTETGTGLGTPSYMSPEQILGDKLDYRSDMFSLGIVLYQMVCGRKPFIEDDHKSVMHKIRLERYPSPRKLNPEIPRELERILARAMQKRKEDRYKSTQDFVLALERFISKRVEMNYHARLVLFLRDKGIITQEEADAQLHPAIAGGYKTPSLPGPLGWAGMKRLASVQGAILGAMALAVAFIHASQIGAPPPVMAAAPPPPKPPGFLKILVDPWAEVYVDGKYADTTPFSKALPIPEGQHKIEFKNPYFNIEKRNVNIKRGAVSTLRIELARK
ncbi:MAG TPA: serine/threonine-protein kinase [Polyangia bacterium]|nr:serine/threonine-protein kinase [Polyangia bacterium]